MPWLLLHGDADEIVPFAHAERLAGAAPDARLVKLNADHLGVEGADSLQALKALRTFVAEVFGGR
jgi:pimeloyl-ACP methyl ester carboxylesterase